MFAEAVVTSGYLWTSILLMALYIAVKSGAVLPVAANDRQEVNPIVAMNVERMLATALGVGLFIVAMIVFASLFPPTGTETSIAMP